MQLEQVLDTAMVVGIFVTDGSPHWLQTAVTVIVQNLPILHSSPQLPYIYTLLI